MENKIDQTEDESVIVKRMHKGLYASYINNVININPNNGNTINIFFNN